MSNPCRANSLWVFFRTPSTGFSPPPEWELTSGCSVLMEHKPVECFFFNFSEMWPKWRNLKSECVLRFFNFTWLCWCLFDPLFHRVPWSLSCLCNISVLVLDPSSPPCCGSDQRNVPSHDSPAWFSAVFTSPPAHTVATTHLCIYCQYILQSVFEAGQVGEEWWIQSKETKTTKPSICVHNVMPWQPGNQVYLFICRSRDYLMETQWAAEQWWLPFDE